MVGRLSKKYASRYFYAVFWCKICAHTLVDPCFRYQFFADKKIMSVEHTCTLLCARARIFFSELIKKKCSSTHIYMYLFGSFDRVAAGLLVTSKLF